ncbi:MAG: FmdB family transcriptional regulator [Actinomycetota bacterium]|jgi:putative FmdB family regulatory protein|nr:FmdB family transcriptional regulator [Actinomycetota bacterium]
MPTYEYACRDCGEHVEVVQNFRDDPITVCGLCGGRLRKVFSAAGIVFKGSGYYVNDSRKRPASDGDGSEGKRGDKGDKADKADAAKAGGAKPDGKSDGKSGGKKDAAKTESTSSANAESA